ncbi:MAG: cytochrome c biogenesis CcdA family protein [bacterium]
MRAPHEQEAPAAERAPIAALLIPIGIVLVALPLLGAVRDRAETAVADLAALLPLGWAFAAGMVSSVNPCGFFILPAYLSYQLGTEEAEFSSSSVLARMGKSLILGASATAGFVVIMGVIGSLIAAGGGGLVRLFPAGGLAIGVALAALGAWLVVTRRSLSIAAAKRVMVAPRRNLGNVFLFGIAYAIGSVSCTLPVFLLVVGSALAAGGFSASLGQFLSYALGMGTILVVVTVGTAFLRGGLIRSLRRVQPSVDRVGAFFLLGAGLYLVYYWLWGAGAIL